MFVKIKNQRGIIKRAIEKAGSYRGLADKLSISRSSILRALAGSSMQSKNYNKIKDFLNIKENLIIEEFPDNFRQKLGGLECVASKKKKGTFSAEMKKWQDLQSKKLKKWHKTMKTNYPKEYYLLQYSRFKKIGGYKFLTKKGEKVRNLFEKQVADILYDLKIDYEYEPLINVGDNYFFPDFLINKKIIIECTMWKGEQKAYKLRDKIAILSPKYEVFVVIPKTLYSYYRLLDRSHLILGLDDFDSVAQTFLSPKGEEGSNR